MAHLQQQQQQQQQQPGSDQRTLFTVRIERPSPDMPTADDLLTMLDEDTCWTKTSLTHIRIRKDSFDLSYTEPQEALLRILLGIWFKQQHFEIFAVEPPLLQLTKLASNRS